MFAGAVFSAGVVFCLERMVAFVVTLIVAVAGGLRSQTAVIFADVDRPVLVPVERRAQRDSNL